MMLKHFAVLQPTTYLSGNELQHKNARKMNDNRVINPIKTGYLLSVTQGGVAFLLFEECNICHTTHLLGARLTNASTQMPLWKSEILFFKDTI